MNIRLLFRTILEATASVASLLTAIVITLILQVACLYVDLGTGFFQSIGTSGFWIIMLIPAWLLCDHLLIRLLERGRNGLFLLNSRGTRISISDLFPRTTIKALPLIAFIELISTEPGSESLNYIIFSLLFWNPCVYIVSGGRDSVPDQILLLKRYRGNPGIETKVKSKHLFYGAVLSIGMTFLGAKAILDTDFYSSMKALISVLNRAIEISSNDTPYGNEIILPNSEILNYLASIDSGVVMVKIIENKDATGSHPTALTRTAGIQLRLWTLNPLRVGQRAKAIAENACLYGLPKGINIASVEVTAKFDILSLMAIAEKNCENQSAKAEGQIILWFSFSR